METRAKPHPVGERAICPTSLSIRVHSWFTAFSRLSHSARRAFALIHLNPKFEARNKCKIPIFKFSKPARPMVSDFDVRISDLVSASPPYLELVPGPGILKTLSKTLSKNFVEIGHFQRNSDKVFRQRSTTKLGVSLLGQALLSRIHAVETNPHPDPLPFTKGEGNLRRHRVRVTEQGSKTGAF
jgi:hypothetical protein